MVGFAGREGLIGRLLPPEGPTEGPIIFAGVELPGHSVNEHQVQARLYLRSNPKLALVNRSNLLVEICIGLELVQCTSLGRGMTVPNDLFALATARLFLCGLFFTRFFVGFGAKNICTRTCQVAERRDNVGTPLKLARLCAPHLEGVALRFPFGIQQLDTSVLGKFVFGNLLTTNRTCRHVLFRSLGRKTW